MKTNRPIDLNLFKFHFPIAAIASILHRVTGIILFLFIPALLYTLQQSLSSREDFYHLQQCLSHPVVKLLLWAVLSSAIYHLLAGFRHLLMDCGLAESRVAGTVSAWSVILLVVVTAVLLGVWLW